MTGMTGICTAYLPVLICYHLSAKSLCLMPTHLHNTHSHEHPTFAPPAADLDSSGQNAVVVQPPKTSAVAPQQRTTTSPQPSAVVLQPPQTNNAVPQPSPAKPPKRPLPHMPQPDLPICQSAPQPNTAMLHPRDIPSPSIHAPKSRPHKAAPPALMSHPSDAIFNARDLSECVWQESQPSALGLPGSQHYHPLPGPAQYDETKQSGSQPSQTIINSSFGTENLSNQNAMVMQRGSSSGVNTQKVRENANARLQEN